MTCTLCRSTFGKDFRCLWAIKREFLDAEWQPSKSKAFVDVRPLPDGTLQTNVFAASDLEEPYRSKVRAWALNFLTTGDGHVLLHIGARTFLVLPTREEDVTGRCFSIIRRSETEWDVLFFANKAESRMVMAAITSQERPRVLS